MYGGQKQTFFFGQSPDFERILLIMGDKAKTKGEYINRGVWCYERLKAQSGGSKILSHTRWTGGRGYLRRGKRIGDERSLDLSWT